MNYCVARHKPFWSSHSHRRKKFRCVGLSQIRVCSDCKFYNETNNTCKVISIVNSESGTVTPVRTLHCRTNEEFCGIEGKFFRRKMKEVKKKNILTDTDEYLEYAEYAESIDHVINKDSDYSSS